MAIQALIFDCDGTLADTMPAHYIAWRKTLAAVAIDFPEDRFYALGGTPSRTIIAMLAAEQGRTIDVDHLARLKEAEFLLTIDSILPIAAVADVVRQYRGQLPLAVATGAVRDVLEKILVQIGLDGWFDAIVTAEDTVRHKPEPDVFMEAAARLGVPPKFCRVYEDSDQGVEAARRAGMEWVDIRTFFTPRRITA